MLINRSGAGRLAVVTAALGVFLILVIGSGVSAATGEFKLKAGHDVAGNVRLLWTAVDDPELHHYNIYWDDEEFDSISGMEAKAGERGTTYVPQELENDVIYYFAVTAVDANGTILAQDFAEKAPSVPHLKEVNYWNLMALFWLVAIIFIYVIWKIPVWADLIEGGA